MKVISWNLNGLKPVLDAGGFAPIADLRPDVVCLQEIRTQETPTILEGYHHYFYPAQRQGVWGTALLSKEEPLELSYGIGDERFDQEGRLICAEYEKLFVLCVYTPNSQKNLARHQFRVDWDDAFEDYIRELSYYKPVVAAGDYNVAIETVDIYEQNRHYGEAERGWASDERGGMLALLDDGFIDAFRLKYPDATHNYTWWSLRKDRRALNRGWRLDYFITSEDLKFYIADVIHHHEIYGSDHCPIELKLVM